MSPGSKDTAPLRRRARHQDGRGADLEIIPTLHELEAALVIRLTVLHPRRRARREKSVCPGASAAHDGARLDGDPSARSPDPAAVPASAARRPAGGVDRGWIAGGLVDGRCHAVGIAAPPRTPVIAGESGRFPSSIMRCVVRSGPTEQLSCVESNIAPRDPCHRLDHRADRGGVVGGMTGRHRGRINRHGR